LSVVYVYVLKLICYQSYPEFQLTSKQPAGSFPSLIFQHLSVYNFFKQKEEEEKDTSILPLRTIPTQRFCFFGVGSTTCTEVSWLDLSKKIHQEAQKTIKMSTPQKIILKKNGT